MLLDIKHKATELKTTLQSIKLDGTMQWVDIVKVFELASTSLQALQSKLSKVLDHIVILPDYSTHEDPSYVPSVISSKLIKEVENAEESAIKDFYKAVDSNEDFEEKTRRFNDFCHDLRALISNDANT